MSETPSNPFFFVRPSEPLGPLDAYSDANLSRAFARSSWEWLWERCLRRKILLEAIGKPHQAEFVLERAGSYRIHRLVPGRYDGPRESALTAGYGVPTPGFDFSYNDGYADLPDGSDDGGAAVRNIFRTSFGIGELGGAVAEMAEGAVGRAEFMAGPHADRSVDASLTLTGQHWSEPYPLNSGGDPQTFAGSMSNHLSVEAFDRTFFPVFRMVGDVRTDDPPALRTVKAWDPAAAAFVDRASYWATTRNPRTPDYDPDHGEFAVAPNGQGYLDLSSFSAIGRMSMSAATAGGLGIPCRFGDGLDSAVLGQQQQRSDGIHGWNWRGDLAGPSWAYGEDSLGRRTVVGVEAGDEIGLPSPERGGTGVISGYGAGLSSLRDGRCFLHPSPDWDGRPTCWAEWGFPHGSPAPVSGTMAGQLAATCLAQPCVPPGDFAFLPSAASGNPSADDVYARDYTRPAQARDACPAAPPSEPAEISRMLSRLTRTLVPVPAVAAIVYGAGSCVDDDRTEGGGNVATCPATTFTLSTRTHVRTDRLVSGHFVGSFKDLLTGMGGRFPAVPMPSGSVSTESRTSFGHYPAERTFDVRTSRTREVVRDVELSAAMLVPVRSGYARPEAKTVETRYGFDQSSSGASGGSSSAEADVSDPTESVEEQAGPETVGETDLLVHPSVLAWARSAKLVAVLDVYAEGTGGDTAETGRSVDGDSEIYGGEVLADRTDGAGTRTDCRRMSVVTVGDVDLSTGAVRSVDLSALMSAAYPADATYCPDPSYSLVSSETHTGDPLCGSVSPRNGTSTYRTRQAYGLRHGCDVRAALLFMEIEWDFDTAAPPSASSSSGWSQAVGLALRFGRAAARSVMASTVLDRGKAELEAARELAGSLSAELGRLQLELDLDPNSDGPSDLLAARAAKAAAEAAAEAAEAELDEAWDAWEEFFEEMMRQLLEQGGYGPAPEGFGREDAERVWGEVDRWDRESVARRIDEARAQRQIDRLSGEYPCANAALDAQAALSDARTAVGRLVAAVTAADERLAAAEDAVADMLAAGSWPDLSDLDGARDATSRLEGLVSIAERTCAPFTDAVDAVRKAVPHAEVAAVVARHAVETFFGLAQQA